MSQFDNDNTTINFLVLCRSVVSRRAQCQTTNQKLTVRRGSQHSDPSQGEDDDMGCLYGVSGSINLLPTIISFREELALIENRILEKEMAAKRRAERLAKNIAVSHQHYFDKIYRKCTLPC